MAITYGFFDSVNGDRKYNADQMSEFYTGIANDGVFQHIDNGLAVSAGTGLTVNVATGRALIRKKWVENDAVLTKTISAASATYARIDAVVIRFSKSNRNVSIVVKDGTPAASPSAPLMTRNSDVYEMALAYVNVAANATSVTVTDKRSDTTVCGWVSVAQQTSGEVDAMLNAMKTGFDGVEYDSPALMVQSCDEVLDAKIPGDYSKNILDPSTIVTGKFVAGDIGSAYEVKTMNPSFSYIVFPIEIGQHYVVSGTSYYWYFIDENNIILYRGGNTSHVTNRVVGTDATTSYPTAKYIIVSYNHKTYPDSSYMIVKGDSAEDMPSTYEPYNAYMFSEQAASAIRQISEAATTSPICYVSTSGSDTNDGLTEGTAFATFQKGIDSGFKTIIAISGTYSNQQIEINGKKDIKIICKSTGYAKTVLDDHSRAANATIDNSIEVTGLTSYNSIYRASLTVGNNTNFYKVFISQELDPIYSNPSYYGRVTTYNAILWEEGADISSFKRIVPVLSLASCESTPGSFYYDGEYIYINPTGGSISGKTYKRTSLDVDEVGVTIENSQDILFDGIGIKYFPMYNVDISGSSHIVFKNCSSWQTSYGTGFRTTNSDVLFDSCVSARVATDGFGITGYGNVDVINCSGIACYDDGVSHHDATSGTIDGGEWAYCYKGGVTPSYGSDVTVKNVYAHNNPNGIYYIADASSRHTDKKMLIENCLSIDNETHDINIVNYNAIVVGCKYRDIDNSGGTVESYGNTVLPE